jgi:hypothetical protein
VDVAFSSHYIRNSNQRRNEGDRLQSGKMRRACISEEWNWLGGG